MLQIELKNINNLNTSIQVGDMIYVTSTTGDLLGQNINKSGTSINADNKVGFLRKIVQNAIVPTTYILHVDNGGFTASVIEGSFLMFSKYNQSDSDIKGYYMEVKLVNNSKKKAELFSLGSEVTESSK